MHTATPSAAVCMLDKNSFQKILILFFLCFGGVAKATVSCEAELGGKKSTGPSQFATAFSNKPSSLTAVLSGTQVPRWDDYNWLLELKAAAKKSKPNVEEVAAIRNEINTYFSQFKQLDASSRYIHADLSYRFFELTLDINLILGIELFKKEYLQEVPTDAALVQQGKATVAANIKRLREKYSLSGFDKTLELVNGVYENSEYGKRALELVDDQLIVTIHRPESGRFWVPIAGFQNQRVTGSSRGSFDHDHRDTVESSLTYQDKEQYVKYSARYKPQYGEARPKLELASPNFYSSASYYGEDLWVVKQEILDERATWTPTDSFSQPTAQNGEQAHWNEMFIPWAHREFLAPYLIESLKNDSFEANSIPPELGPRISAAGWGGSYTEVQIWGPLTLKDIDTFAFTRNPPDEALVKILRAYGIKIVDARQIPAIPYMPGVSR